MSQHDYDIANQSFPSFRTDLNNVLGAINSSNSGTSRPSSAVAGTIWFNTSDNLIYLYDGSTDISLVSTSASWEVKTTSFTGVASGKYLINTSGGVVTATLPASPSTGDEISFLDQGYDFNTNALTVGRNGSNIANGASDLVVNTQGAAFTLVYSGDATTGWTYKDK
jgi:UDP-N-acetylglucosamine enolpyruvyl transferase